MLFTRGLCVVITLLFAGCAFCGNSFVAPPPAYLTYIAPYGYVYFSTGSLYTNINPGGYTLDFTFPSIPNGAYFLQGVFRMYQDVGDPVSVSGTDNSEYVTLTFDTDPGYSAVFFDSNPNNQGSWITIREGPPGPNTLPAGDDYGYSDTKSGMLFFIGNGGSDPSWFTPGDITASLTFSAAVDQSEVNPTNNYSPEAAGFFYGGLFFSLATLGGDPHVKLISGEKFDLVKEGVFHLFSSENLHVNGNLKNQFLQEVGLVSPHGRFHLSSVEGETILTLNGKPVPLGSSADNWSFVSYPDHMRNMHEELGALLTSLFRIRDGNFIFEVSGGHIPFHSDLPFFNVKTIGIRNGSPYEEIHPSRFGLLQLKNAPFRSERDLDDEVITSFQVGDLFEF